MTGRSTMGKGAAEVAAPTLEADFLQASRQYPDRLAIASPFGATSYGQLTELVAGLAAAGGPLADLPQGSVLTCSLADPARLLALLYACARLGLIVCPLDWRLKPAERGRLAIPAAPRVHVDDGAFESLLGSASAPAHRPTVSADTLFYLGLTSGSTGAPKGILRTQASWARSFRAMTVEFGLSAEDRIVVAGSLAYSFFLTAALHGLSLGAEVLCPDKFIASKVVTTAARSNASVLYLVPTMARQLITELDRRALPSVHTVVAAGARWPVHEKQQLDARLKNARLIEYYGSSEMGFVSVSTPAELSARPAAVGRAFLGVEISIRDADGLEVEPNVEGTIHARSPLTFARLLGESDSVAPRSTTRAWVSAGDRGWLDEAGYLYLAGRADERINVGGQKVYAAEIEQQLLAHPGVADALVVGLADPKLGQVVGALVEPKAGTSVSETQLTTWLRSRLSTYKLPRRLAIMAQLPRTGNGKPARGRARQLLAANASEASDR